MYHLSNLCIRFKCKKKHFAESRGTFLLFSEFSTATLHDTSLLLVNDLSLLPKLMFYSNFKQRYYARWRVQTYLEGCFAYLMWFTINVFRWYLTKNDDNAIAEPKPVYLLRTLTLLRLSDMTMSHIVTSQKGCMILKWCTCPLVQLISMALYQGFWWISKLKSYFFLSITSRLFCQNGMIFELAIYTANLIVGCLLRRFNFTWVEVLWLVVSFNSRFRTFELSWIMTVEINLFRIYSICGIETVPLCWRKIVFLIIILADEFADALLCIA